MKTTPLSERLRTMLKGERIIEPYDKRLGNRISAINSHYKGKFLSSFVSILVNPTTAESEKVCVITCLCELPER